MMNGPGKPSLAAARFPGDGNAGPYLARQPRLVGDAPHGRQLAIEPVQPKLRGRSLPDSDETLRIPKFRGFFLREISCRLVVQCPQRFRKRNESREDRK